MVRKISVAQNRSQKRSHQTAQTFATIGPASVFKKDIFSTVIYNLSAKIPFKSMRKQKYSIPSCGCESYCLDKSDLHRKKCPYCRRRQGDSKICDTCFQRSQLCLSCILYIRSADSDTEYESRMTGLTARMRQFISAVKMDLDGKWVKDESDLKLYASKSNVQQLLKMTTKLRWSRRIPLTQLQWQRKRQRSKTERFPSLL